MFGFGKTPGQEKKPGVIKSLKEKLSRTRSNLSDGLGTLLLGRKTIDDDLLEELENRLLTADIGIEATQEILTQTTERLARKEGNDPEAMLDALKTSMLELLSPHESPLQPEARNKT